MIPAALALALAVVGGCDHRADPCASSDGPQFRCWLMSHPEAEHG